MSDAHRLPLRQIRQPSPPFAGGFAAQVNSSPVVISTGPLIPGQLPVVGAWADPEYTTPLIVSRSGSPVWKWSTRIWAVTPAPNVGTIVQLELIG